MQIAAGHRPRNNAHEWHLPAGLGQRDARERALEEVGCHDSPSGVGLAYNKLTPFGKRTWSRGKSPSAVGLRSHGSRLCYCKDRLKCVNPVAAVGKAGPDAANA